jgi:hypothetical protein
MEEIRALTYAELDASLTLSQYAFQYTLSPEELKQKKEKQKPEQTWGLFVSGQLARILAK